MVFEVRRPLTIARNLAHALLSYVNGGRRPGVRYVSEQNDWVIKREGLALLGKIATLYPQAPVQMTYSVTGLYNKLVHFGSLWLFAANVSKLHKSNRIAVTVYHGYEGMGGDSQAAIAALKANKDRLSAVITACAIMEERLKSWGISPEIIHRIEIGTDLSNFSPPSIENKRALRQRLGIPEDSICIGSFQKDGDGWGDGMSPKLIKGPDLLVNAAVELAKRFPIFLLLLGPARGYVKQRLQDAGIAYVHCYEEDFSKLPSYYHCLDLYLVTSREEGGPKAISECMATGVPLVCTRVGMAPDVIKSGTNGILVDVEDLEGIVHAAAEILLHPALKARFIEEGLLTAPSLDVTRLAEKLYLRVYKPQLSQLR